MAALWPKEDLDLLRWLMQANKSAVWMAAAFKNRRSVRSIESMVKKLRAETAIVPADVSLRIRDLHHEGHNATEIAAIVGLPFQRVRAVLLNVHALVPHPAKKSVSLRQERNVDASEYAEKALISDEAIASIYEAFGRYGNPRFPNLVLEPM